MSLASLLAALLVAGLAASPARAQQPPGPDRQGSDRFVTIAARWCPTYGDVAANRSRNNIQESLRDLGPDTPYQTGENVNPAKEALAPQDACTPIPIPVTPPGTPGPGWRFKLGHSIDAAKDVGDWGSLSRVAGPFSPDRTITTQASVPDRDQHGDPDASKPAILGATTIELSTAEAFQAAGGKDGKQQLWIQGGVQGDPVLDDVPEFANQYGFAALRCATDNVNGDNVEYIRFPSGTEHVYCFAYYVRPPPTAGTIVIKKATDPANADLTFNFEGTVSYNPGGKFTLNAKSNPSATFYRAGVTSDSDPTRWTAAEPQSLWPKGWALAGRECDVEGPNGTAGTSTAETNLPGQEVSIRLVSGDTVTCTFTDNNLPPPPGKLLLSKVTAGGTGRFGFTVAREDGQGDPIRTSATTEDQDEPAEVKAGLIDLKPGVSYVITETVPRVRGGRWVPRAATCSTLQRTRSRRQSRSITVKVDSGEGIACTFGNRFVPRGSIAIAKTTRGRAGTAGFVITPARATSRQYFKSATTDRDNGTAIATGDSTRRLRLGEYVIQETDITPEGDGRWTLLAVTCGGRLRAFQQGQTTVELTREHPRAACRFINGFTPDAPPLPDPTPPTPQPSPLPPDAQPDLVLTKRAVRGTVRFGEIARFAITVRNAGDAAAEQVIVADGPGENAQLASARASQGGCGERTPLICRIGLLGPGERATVRVRVRATGAPRITNLAVVGSATREAALANNVARARVRVRSEGGVLGHCASAVAHAAC